MYNTNYSILTIGCTCWMLTIWPLTYLSYCTYIHLLNIHTVVDQLICKRMSENHPASKYWLLLQTPRCTHHCTRMALNRILTTWNIPQRWESMLKTYTGSKSRTEDKILKVVSADVSSQLSQHGYTMSTWFPVLTFCGSMVAILSLQEICDVPQSSNTS